MGEVDRIKSIIAKYEKQRKDIEVKSNEAFIKETTELSDLITEKEKNSIELRKFDLKIEKLKDELSALNPGDINLENEYKKQIEEVENSLEKIRLEERQKEIDEEEKELQEFLTKNQSGKKEDVEKEQKALDDKLRKALTEQIALVEKKKEDNKLRTEIILYKLKYFKPEYKEGYREIEDYIIDENGEEKKVVKTEKVKVQTNRGEEKKLNRDYQELKKATADYDEIIKICKEKLQEFADRDEKAVEAINKALKREPQIPQKPEQQENPENNQEQPEGQENSENDQEQPEGQENSENDQEQPGGQENSENNQEKPEQSENSENNQEQSEQQVNDNKYIYISEKNSKIQYYKNDKLVSEMNLAIETKGKTFRRLNINEIIKNTIDNQSGIKGFWKKQGLSMKINPSIIKALEMTDNKNLIQPYIESIYNGNELPFELVHDVSDLGMLGKLRANIYTRAENNCGAHILGKVYNKNKTLTAGKDVEKTETAVKEVKNETAKNVQNIMNENKQRTVLSGKNQLTDEEKEQARADELARRKKRREATSFVEKVDGNQEEIAKKHQEESKQQLAKEEPKRDIAELLSVADISVSSKEAIKQYIRDNGEEAARQRFSNVFAEAETKLSIREFLAEVREERLPGNQIIKKQQQSEKDEEI